MVVGAIVVGGDAGPTGVAIGGAAAIVVGYAGVEYAAVGYVAVGAAAIVAADEAGNGVAGDGVAEYGVTGGAATATATDLADGGIANAAVSDWGVALVEGSTGGTAGDSTSGAAERATSELSSDAVPFFHQAMREGTCAQRGPDWQPASVATISTIPTNWLDLEFMRRVTLWPTARGPSIGGAWPGVGGVCEAYVRV